MPVKPALGVGLPPAVPSSCLSAAGGVPLGWTGAGHRRIVPAVPDLTPTILPLLRSHRLPELDLGADAIHPDYAGLSILNLAASLERWFGLTPGPHAPLAIETLNPMAADARQVVVCLLDAVSFSRFTGWLDGPGRALQPLIADGLLATLTSVVPSTTASALTTLWTGRSPAEHGILGYELLLREYGLIANMITLAPAAFDNQRGLLERAGVRPQTLLPLSTLGTRLTRAGIEAHAFIGNSIRNSGLSRMHYADAALHGFGSPADLWHSLRQLVESPTSGRRFVWAYYSGIDALSHVYGPDSDLARAEYEFFVRAMLDLFVQPLDRRVGRQVLLLLLADHGQVATTIQPHYQLAQHPGLARRLHLSPTGEARLPYLYLRPGQAAAVDEYVERAWPGAFTRLDSDHALSAGLFGPGTPSEQAASRLGDVLLISRGAAYLWWPDKPDTLLGRHGSLTAEEMLVPLLAARLG
jgi:hypothetical protein